MFQTSNPPQGFENTRGLIEDGSPLEDQVISSLQLISVSNTEKNASMKKTHRFHHFKRNRKPIQSTKNSTNQDNPFKNSSQSDLNNIPFPVFSPKPVINSSTIPLPSQSCHFVPTQESLGSNTSSSTILQNPTSNLFGQQNSIPSISSNSSPSTSSSTFEWLENFDELQREQDNFKIQEMNLSKKRSEFIDLCLSKIGSLSQSLKQSEEITKQNNKKMDDHLNQLNEELEEIKKRNQEIIQSNSQLETKVTELSKLEQTHKNEIEKLNHICYQLKEDKKRLISDNQILETNIKFLQEENQDIINLYKDKKSEFEKLNLLKVGDNLEDMDQDEVFAYIENSYRLQKLIMKKNETLKKEKEKDIDARICEVCSSALKNTIFSPCGHLCLCSNCAERVETCPICRAGIEKKIRTYIY